MVDVVQEAKACLEPVLDFYSSKHISLLKVPEVVYRPVKQDDVLAYVAGELEHGISFRRELAFATSNLVWMKQYGLSVSRQALEELASKFEVIVGKSDIVNSLEPNTIYLGRRFANKEIASKTAMLAHEVWHLIEQQERCFFTHPFISEGTATYAESFFRPAEFLKTRIYEEDIVDLKYRVAANFVHRLMISDNLPLDGLLKKDVRDKIQTTFSDVFVKGCFDAHLASTNTEEGLQKAKESLLRIGFNNFDGTLDRNRLLEIYRNFGLVKLADELTSQDLSLLLTDYKKMGF